jgi:hypothetical protein
MALEPEESKSKQDECPLPMDVQLVRCLDVLADFGRPVQCFSVQSVDPRLYRVERDAMRGALRQRDSALLLLPVEPVLEPGALHQASAFVPVPLSAWMIPEDHWTSLDSLSQSPRSTGPRFPAVASVDVEMESGPPANLKSVLVGPVFHAVVTES